MKAKSLVGICAGLILAVGASSASALVIDLRNQGHFHGWGDYRYYHYNGGSALQLYATGYENGFSDREAVTRDGNGLGVNSDGDNTSQLDGTNGTEWLRFSVNRTIRLNWVDFRRYGGNDDFNVNIDGYWRRELDADPWYANRIVYNWFAIGADHRSDEFRVARLGVTLVPEPGSIGLMLLGLIGIVLGRRFRKA